ncbi:MAG: molybdopterin-dependent oxidoreductase, partial [Burkholderiaceae bacterium]
LPIAPFTETAGTFINCEGRVQSFNGTVRPAGEARPGWKVLRVLGNLLDLEGFEYETAAQVRTEAVPADLAAMLSNDISIPPVKPQSALGSASPAERISDVPIYFSDAIVRRSAPLQKTRDAGPPKARANAQTLQSFRVANGDKVCVKQGDASALLEVALDDSIADGAVLVSAGHESTATLGAMFGPITLELA